jgi:hypothetical protein
MTSDTMSRIGSIGALSAFESRAQALDNPFLTAKPKEGPTCPYDGGTVQFVLWSQMQDAINSKECAEMMIADYQSAKTAAEITVEAMADALVKLENKKKR